MHSGGMKCPSWDDMHGDGMGSTVIEREEVRNSGMKCSRWDEML